MAATHESGPVQGSIDRVRAEMERLVDLARERSGKALDAVGIKPSAGEGFPAIDITETHEAVHVMANLPGVSAELLDVNITGQILRLRGSVAASPHLQGGTVHRAERHGGAFERAYALPCPVNAEAVQADLANGVLHIRLPKIPDEVGFKVPVRTAAPESPAAPGSPTPAG